jgi:hypothetical protein
VIVLVSPHEPTPGVYHESWPEYEPEPEPDALLEVAAGAELEVVGATYTGVELVVGATYTGVELVVGAT